MNQVRFFIVLLATIHLVSCAKILTKNSPTKTSESKRSSESLGDNNVIVNDSKNVSSIHSQGGDKVIFEGKNNLFELVRVNAAYFDKHHDVLIIKGDNNIIKLYNTNLVDLRGKGADTLVIVGNQVKYVADYANALVVRSAEVKVDTVELRETNPNLNAYFSDFKEEQDQQVTLKYFDEPVRVKYAFDYFVSKINTGNAEYYFQLGEMYLYGIGTKVSTLKAVELYEYAAKKNHILAIRQLGDIYQRGTFDLKKDTILSTYYYKVGAQLGDVYCSEALTN